MITATSNTSPTTHSALAAKTNASAISTDFETFLKMLTAQANNQDPLEPIDSSEYAAQLAQFSMVEQQVLSNDLLESLASQLGSGSLTQLSTWVGKEVRTKAPALFSGAPIELELPATPSADSAVLIIKDKSGKELQRLSMEPKGGPVTWAGVREDGTAFPNGAYQFETESFAKEASLGTKPVQSYIRVTEARIENGKTQLVLAGGIPISPKDVTGLREAR